MLTVLRLYKLSGDKLLSHVLSKDSDRSNSSQGASRHHLPGPRFRPWRTWYALVCRAVHELGTATTRPIMMFVTKI